MLNFSDKEIITKDGYVIDLKTKEKTTIKKVYPGTAGKHVVMVNGANEIAYHYEKGEDSLLDGALIGSDKVGNIVDIWNIPKLSKKQYELLSGNSYSSLIFNGNKMMAKFISLSIDKDSYYETDL